MRQKQDVPNITDKDTATDYEHAEGEVQVPRVID
jgi:hypothetical protein